VELLQLLQAHCRRAGVKLQFESRVNEVANFEDYDVIIGADGLNSMVRKQFESIFRPSFQTRRNKFAWYGTERLFRPLSLIFCRTQHGIFIGHTYQYNKKLSTFIVETDPETWQAAGLDRMTDEESRRYCAEVFKDELHGCPLLSNRSLWFQATVIRNEQWFHRNIVLIGDALRTVHFSLGSGTRMAMQDSIALAHAFRTHGDDVQAAFREFERVRRPHSEEFQETARKSLDWYENVASLMHLDPLAFTYDYMRRTGRLSHEDLRKRDPKFVAEYEQFMRRANISEMKTGN
jgi:anthraniloyl-CoA monooxygenase